MIEIAGLVLTGVGVSKDLYQLYRDLKDWPEIDLTVDRQWLSLALSRGILEGSDADYRWVSEDSVASLELKGSYQVTAPYDAENKVKYRIVRETRPRKLVLMRHVAVPKV